MNMNQLQMNPDEAAASLAFATQLEEGLLPMGEEEIVEEPMQEPMAEPTLREQYPEEEGGLMEVKEEIAALREEIQQALAEDDEEGEKDEQSES